jgi:hypothetical protein
VAPNLFFKALESGDQLGRAQLGCSSGGAIHEIGQAITCIEERSVFGWR